ncbi:MAG TPA: VOC family protein [Gemmatimonadaceae bacterium]|jgi:predicted 3-demethylubiquinone-9 3-methyltransferase (glyoxalase superfamily)
MAQRVATHLMFTGEASAALALYASIFPAFRVDHVEKYAQGEMGPEGTVKRADATFCGQSIIVIDSPVKHAFTFTPSTSIFVDCESASELDIAFGQLAEQGQVYMPLGAYGFSRRFGWCSDRFGVSWQLNLP